MARISNQLISIALLALLACGAFAQETQLAAPEPAEFHVTSDGHRIPIQREWAVQNDPANFYDIPLGEQPFRFDQRQPRFLHAEPRPGQSPLYYFEDVRWRQTERDPADADSPRKAYFTTVKVDLDKVRAAYFCMKPFAPKFVAGHAALLLEFEPGGFMSLDGEDGGGFVLSYEAYLRVTQKYEMIGGQFARKFRIIYVVSTWRDFLHRSIRISDSVVKRWKLKLTDEQLRQLALDVGKTVMADHSEARYNTTRNSCVTAVLDLINLILPEEKKMKRKWLFGIIQNPFWALPVMADNILKMKGLLATPKETITEIPPE